MGGATFNAWVYGTEFRGLSPRGRGNPIRRTFSTISARSIPAWAGQPAGAAGFHSLYRVYPRVGGATPVNTSQTVDVTGLSPRGRGNLPGPCGKRRLSRSIPAWAGQPLIPPAQQLVDGVYPRVGGATD